MEPASLRSIPLFEHVGDDMLARIAERGTEFEAASGHVLIEVGQPGAGLFVIEEGTVSVEFPGGRRIELGAGEFVGDLALLTDHPHAARVRAATRVRCRDLARRVRRTASVRAAGGGGHAPRARAPADLIAVTA